MLFHGNGLCHLHTGPVVSKNPFEARSHAPEVTTYQVSLRTNLTSRSPTTFFVRTAYLRLAINAYYCTSASNMLTENPSNKE